MVTQMGWENFQSRILGVKNHQPEASGIVVNFG
jgi:hypothetical protein